LATSIAAGKKDEGNTFTGTMIGDWSSTAADGSITEATGIYGFHKGAMAYAFMDNGKAFIGKDGKGRINFNNETNEATISGGYNTNGTAPNMTINLTNG
jgi:hypothetical protein